MSINPTLHFPKQEELVKSLEKHPKLSPAFFRDKEIIQKVAKVFANTEIDFSGLDIGVAFCLRDLKSINSRSKEPIEILQVTKDQIKEVLLEALKDCSEEKLL